MVSSFIFLHKRLKMHLTRFMVVKKTHVCRHKTCSCSSRFHSFGLFGMVGMSLQLASKIDNGTKHFSLELMVISMIKRWNVCKANKPHLGVNGHESELEEKEEQQHLDRNEMQHHHSA